MPNDTDSTVRGRKCEDTAEPNTGADASNIHLLDSDSAVTLDVISDYRHCYWQRFRHRYQFIDGRDVCVQVVGSKIENK